MKRNVAIVLAAMTATIGVPFLAPAIAETCASAEVEGSCSEALLPPRVDRVGVRATLLYRGMPATDVERIMGPQVQANAADGEGGSVRVLKDAAEPIATKVTITNGRLSGVALDVARIDDLTLPNFSRAALLGMSRTAVLQMLGTPVEDHLRDGYGMTVEQMIFKRPGEPDVSIFLIDGRVVTKKVGTSFPIDILSFALPLARDPTEEEIDHAAAWPKQQRVRVGMKMSGVQMLFGAAKMEVHSTFKSRPVEYAIFETKPDQSFARFTFIDGILTEFADGGNTPLSQVLDGR